MIKGKEIKLVQTTNWNFDKFDQEQQLEINQLLNNIFTL